MVDDGGVGLDVGAGLVVDRLTVGWLVAVGLVVGVVLSWSWRRILREINHTLLL